MMVNKTVLLVIFTIFLLNCVSSYENIIYEGISLGTPEILADMPWRIEADVDFIPVLIIFHDFDDTDNSYTLDSVYVYDMNNNDQSENIYNSTGYAIGNTLG